MNELEPNCNKKTVTLYNSLLQSKTTGDFYTLLPQPEHYKNLSTGQEGHISNEIVSKYLLIPVTANIMQIKNENLSLLIETLGLSFLK